MANEANTARSTPSKNEGKTSPASLKAVDGQRRDALGARRQKGMAESSALRPSPTGRPYGSDQI